MSLFLALWPAMAAGPLRAADSSPGLDIFFTANRLSRLESCGCRSRQQGGVQFEAPLYAAATSALRVDLGDWTAYGIGDLPLEALQTRFLLRAFARLGFDAITPSPRDLELTAAAFEDLARRFPSERPPLVSANVFLKVDPSRRAFATSRIVQKSIGGTTVTIALTGVTIPGDMEGATHRTGTPRQFETRDFVARDPLACLKPLVAELRPQADLVIILSSGSAASGAEIARACPEADLVLVRNALGAPQASFYFERGVRVVCARGTLGREVGHLSLARDRAGKWQFKTVPESLGVTQDRPPEPRLLALIDEFKQATRSLEAPLPPPGIRQVYGGVALCKACHGAQHAHWSATPHARALQTLIDRGQQFNPSCLKCHVTGFRQFNGFYAVSHGPSLKLANVQCEVCHGPALDHANTQFKLAAARQQGADASGPDNETEAARRLQPGKHVEAARCLACHTPENDGHFVYEEKLARVRH